MKKEEISKINENILDYLKKKNFKGEFPARTFYGELFTALSMALKNKEKYTETINDIVNYYILKKDKTLENFHWEFNNYALLKLSAFFDNYNNYLKPLKFKGTKCSNWTMLRGLVRIIAEENLKKGLKEIKEKVKKYQLKSGLIKDDKGVNSFQYHSFMLFILIEAYEITQKSWILDAFKNGIEFICNITLKNGDNSYIGRGQEQIFGYGPLIYSLEKAFFYTKNSKYKEMQKRVFGYLKKYIRDDGSIPLVLRKEEIGYPKEIDVNDNNYLGWYGYNNYFDYLPFLSYFLTLTEKIYVEHEKGNNEVQGYYYDKDYFIKRNNEYEAVIAKPQNDGYLTNDMSMPYILVNGIRLTPMYGGEEYGSELYSVEDIPLPNLTMINSRKIAESVYQLLFFCSISLEKRIKKILKTILKKENENKYYFKYNLKYKLQEDGNILGNGYLFKHERKFEFKENFILVTENIKIKKNIQVKKFKILNIFILGDISKQDNKKFQIEIEKRKFKIEFENLNNIEIEKEKKYCAIGEMKNISSYINDKVLKKGENISFAYKIFLDERI